MIPEDQKQQEPRAVRMSMTLFDASKWQEIGQSLSRHWLRTVLTGLSVFWGMFLLVCGQESIPNTGHPDCSGENLRVILGSNIQRDNTEAREKSLVSLVKQTSAVELYAVD